IVIVGSLCSGKDTVASLINDKIRGRQANLSSLLKDVLATRGIFTPKRADYYVTGDTLRKLFGENILSLVTINLLQGEFRSIVCTGPRFLEEVKVFQGSKVVGVIVDPKNAEDNVTKRFQRYKYRNRSSDVLTLNDFLAREAEEREGLQTIFSSGIVTHWIINDSTFSNLHLQIENLSWVKNRS